MSEQILRVKYSYEAGKFPISEIKKAQESDGNVGGCDAFVFLSIVYPPDGSSSHMVLSGDGRTGGPLAESEKFKAWSIFANYLAHSEGLDPKWRAIARQAFETTRGEVLARRALNITYRGDT